MSKDVTPDQRRRIVEELADIATKLETARDSSAKANHAIVDFNRACEKAGRLVILAIDSGILPHDCLPSATWKQYETKPSTDREMSFYWTVGVAPWLRSVAGPRSSERARGDATSLATRETIAAS